MLTNEQTSQLTEDQIARLWERMIGAETRSLYFADLANRYSVQKQTITGVSFVFSTSAVATLLAHSYEWIPPILSSVVAIATAYSMATGLDRKVQTMAKLHYSWNTIANDYARLWNHTYEDNAESLLDELIGKEQQLSELAATDAPNDQDRMKRWEDHVFQMHKLSA